MNEEIRTLVVEFMEELYLHVRSKTPSFMPRPEAEVTLAATMTDLLARAIAELESAQTSEDVLLGMAPLIEQMAGVIASCTEAGDEQDAWLGQLAHFRSYVIGELTSEE